MKILLLTSFYLTINFFSFSQEKSSYINTTKSGVNVYTSNGVEGVVKDQVSKLQNQQFPISEYNIVQCESAISDIKSKIIAVEGEIDALKQIDSYRKKLILLENRINEINNESHGK